MNEEHAAALLLALAAPNTKAAPALIRSLEQSRLLVGGDVLEGCWPIHLGDHPVAVVPHSQAGSFLDPNPRHPARCRRRRMIGATGVSMSPQGRHLNFRHRVITKQSQSLETAKKT